MCATSSDGSTRSGGQAGGGAPALTAALQAASWAASFFLRSFSSFLLSTGASDTAHSHHPSLKCIWTGSPSGSSDRDAPSATRGGAGRTHARGCHSTRGTPSVSSSAAYRSCTIPGSGPPSAASSVAAYHEPLNPSSVGPTSTESPGEKRVSCVSSGSGARGVTKGAGPPSPAKLHTPSTCRSSTVAASGAASATAASSGEGPPPAASAASADSSTCLRSSGSPAPARRTRSAAPDAPARWRTIEYCGADAVPPTLHAGRSLAAGTSSSARGSVHRTRKSWSDPSSGGRPTLSRMTGSQCAPPPSSCTASTISRVRRRAIHPSGVAGGAGRISDAERHSF
mmetsp:Transcript_9090/g.29230  ORF Transcript_9090/g.29230 Transcript_9090/m.29230 type:complete len:340 (+) Transcript_9090:317-1336(+)